jgi:glycosyltransferase involved in cell wall biosynthesis
MKMARIGLLYPAPDPASPDNWSGTPRGLHDGFTAQGLTVVPVPYRPGPGVQQAIAVLARTGGRRGVAARRSPVASAARSRLLARSFRRAQPLDALVAMQTDVYDLAKVLGSSMIPVATYDDGTFAQFQNHADSDLRRSGFPVQDVQMWAARQAIACNRATSACVSTSYGARSIIDDYGVPAERVHVVGMGHRRREIDPSGRDWSTPRFLFVGVDWGRKNGAAVLAAFAAVRQSYPQATLDIVGDHPVLDAPGVTGHGFLARSDQAAQRKLDGMFARSTAFVLPSRFDPSPIAYLEAASCGLPVIATTEGGAHELIGEAAITVHPDDEAGLIAAMLRLAEPDMARRLGAEALRRSQDSTWLEVSRRILRTLGLSVPGAVEQATIGPAPGGAP